MLDLAKQIVDLAILFFITGVILLLFGLIGGGLSIKEIKIPKINFISRSLCVLIGFLLLSISVFIRINEQISLSDKNSVKIETYDTGIQYYRVCYVKQDDPDGGLVVREKPGTIKFGVTHLQVGLIPFGGRKVKYLNERSLINENYWYHIRYSPSEYSNSAPTAGWVNSRYLCPDDGNCDC